MGTPLSTGTAGERTPSLKLRNVGDHVDAAVVDLDLDLPRYEFGTQNPKLNRAGKPMTQHRLIVVVTGGAGVISEDDVDRPANTGEVAAIYIAGRDKWDPDLDKARTGNVGRSWGAALDNLDGDLQVGDVLRWKFEDEIPGQGAQPRKVRTFRLRHAKPDEAEQVDRCEQLRRDRQATVLAPAGGSSSSSWDDEEPF